jgi:predicted AAA+ superfamily ATPase
MSHHRTREVITLFKKTAAWSPTVALLGMRQTGKTTILKEMSGSYITFDDPLQIPRFQRGGSSLLEVGPFPLALDEVQKFPLIFDYLKFIIDQNKKPGRFLITGSVRFASKRGIRESLTGRVALLDLYPLTLSECHSRSQKTFLEVLVKNLHTPPKLLSALAQRAWASESEILHYLNSGGLPGLCFKREVAIRNQLMSDHLDTLLTRDIQLVTQTSLSSLKLIHIFRVIAANQGSTLNISAMARDNSCSPPTLKKALDAMEALFLIRSHGKFYFAEDQGLATFAVRSENFSPRMQILRFIFHELRAMVGYHFRAQCEMSNYQTRGGVDIPFIFQFQNGVRLALAIDGDETASDKNLRSITWYRKKFPKSFGVVIHRGTKSFITSNGTLCIPWSWVP